MYEGQIAETIFYPGQDGEPIETYYARPLGQGPFPGVLVIHHMPGWDEQTKEITRRFAHHGYVAIAPHLFSREGEGGAIRPDDAAAAARAAGGVPDARFLADAAGAIAYVKAQPYTNNKVGVIGYCSGGRQSWLLACSQELDAAVVCYGGRIVATPEELTPERPVAPLDLAGELSCPLLGLFGVEDTNPSPEHVKLMDEALSVQQKSFEFHSYENTGHSFFSVDRPAYRVESANDGWERIFDFYDKYLSEA